jgi:hypothetical protein
MTADSDSPIAIAPIPICKALIHAGGFTPIILVAAMINSYKERLHLRSLADIG